MAHEGLIGVPARAAAFLLRGMTFLAPFLVGACGGGPRRVAAPLHAEGGQGKGGAFPDEPGALLRYHSLRFKLSVALPDGRAWKIDDHHARELVATHAPTRSTLTLYTFSEPELMNRQLCEARSREAGLVTLDEPRTVADETTTGPDAYDTRIWIALEAGVAPGPTLTGHAFLFGAYIRKCLFVHYATSVPSGKDEPTLTSRLATARLLILAGLRMEPFDEPRPVDSPLRHVLPEAAR